MLENFPHIIVLDDTEAIMLAVSDTFASGRYSVTGFTEINKALEAIRTTRDISYLLIDKDCPDRNAGLDVISEFHALHPYVPRALMTGDYHGKARPEIEQYPVGRVIGKPCSREELLSIIAADLRAAREGTYGVSAVPIYGGAASSKVL